MAILKNFNVPSPRWYRITKKIWSNVENLFIVIWLATGHTQDSLTLLIFKACSSFIKDNLDTFLTDGTEYAPAGTIQALAVSTGIDNPKEAVKSVIGKDAKPLPETDK